MERVKTGINGLDKLIQGGFPKGSIVLVSGAAGTGKSIFGLQFIVKGAMEYGEKGIYLMFEQDKKATLQQAKGFGWNIEELEKKKLMQIICLPYIGSIEGLENIKVRSRAPKLTQAFIEINKLKEFKYERLVVDSLSSLTLQLPPDSSIVAKKDAVLELFTEIKDTGAPTTIVTSELPLESRWYSRDTISEFVADGVILLKSIAMADSFTRTIEIKKMRGTKIDGTPHRFDFYKNGIKIE